MSPFIFIISPLSGPDQARSIEFAERVCREISLRTPFIPLASHLICTRYLNDTIIAERELGMRHGLEMIKISSVGVMILPTWRDAWSTGMLADEYRCFSNNVPVLHSSRGTNIERIDWVVKKLLEIHELASRSNFE
jgi:hypothetical protein